MSGRCDLLLVSSCRAPGATASASGLADDDFIEGDEQDVGPAPNAVATPAPRPRASRPRAAQKRSRTAMDDGDDEEEQLEIAGGHGLRGGRDGGSGGGDGGGGGSGKGCCCLLLDAYSVEGWLVLLPAGCMANLGVLYTGAYEHLLVYPWR